MARKNLYAVLSHFGVSITPFSPPCGGEVRRVTNFEVSECSDSAEGSVLFSGVVFIMQVRPLGCVLYVIV